MRLKRKATSKFFVGITKIYILFILIFWCQTYILSSIYSESQTKTKHGSGPFKPNEYRTLKIDIGDHFQTSNTLNTTHQYQEW